jgi:hypothetical protein
LQANDIRGFAGDSGKSAAGHDIRACMHHFFRLPTLIEKFCWQETMKNLTI